MADQHKVSPTITAESEERSYVFKVHGYSRAKELFKNGECVASPRFSVAGDNWVLRYYPNGRTVEELDGFISLVHDSAYAKDMNAKARSISLIGKDGLPVPPCHGGMIEMDHVFQMVYNNSLGLIINRKKLEQSAHIIDDCLTIKCDLNHKKDIQSEETYGNQYVVVPPTDLHLQFGNLLDSMDGADVTFHVGGEKFLAHRIVLAARSSVFKAVGSRKLVYTSSLLLPIWRR